jgi:hypothetical protein
MNAPPKLCVSAPLRLCVNVSGQPAPARNVPSPFRGFRKLFCLLLLLTTFPIAAQAQWATSRVEHDWRITINGNSYGLEQRFTSTFSTVAGWRTTTIFFGQHTFRTNLPAVWVAALALAPLLAVAFFLVAGSRRMHEPMPADSALKPIPIRNRDC